MEKNHTAAGLFFGLNSITPNRRTRDLLTLRSTTLRSPRSLVQCHPAALGS